jgi:hypothetical protein
MTTGTTIPVFVDFLQTTVLPVLGEQKPDAILVMDNPQEPSGQGRHHGGGADTAIPAPLFSRLLAHRALLVKDQSASHGGENR